MSEIDEKEIERRFEAISKFDLAPEVTTRDIERARENLTRKINNLQPKPTKIWGIFLKSKIKYKVALIGCAITLSVTAAMTGPSVYRTIQAFLASLDDKRVPELVELADPMSAVPHQVQDINNLLTESKLKLKSLYADSNYALAVTTDIVVIDKVYDQGRQKGPLVITLVKRDNMWLVTDIDIETEATVKIELDRFLKKHPDATEIATR